MRLTENVNLGKLGNMIADLFLFVLRLLLTAAVIGFVWTLVKPRTQSMRIVRAVLLALCLLATLVALRAAGVG